MRNHKEAELQAVKCQAAVFEALLAARSLASHRIDEMLRHIEHAEAVGQPICPRAFPQISRALAEGKAILTAALPLWEIGRKLGADAAEAHRGG